MAKTQTSGSLFRRSFDCAQDDRLGCHPESLLCCHPDRSGGISRQWQRLRLQALCSGDPSTALRMTGLGATPSRYYAVIPTAVEGSPSGRSFGSLRSLRMVKSTVIPRSGGSQPVGRRSFGSLRSLRMVKSTVIPTAVEGSQPVGRRSFGSLRSLRMVKSTVIPTAVEGSQLVGRRSFGSLRSLRMIGFADHLQGLFSVEFHPVKIKVILVCFFYEWYYHPSKPNPIITSALLLLRLQILSGRGLFAPAAARTKDKK